jgi:lysophospholipase L1-like esterase
VKKKNDIFDGMKKLFFTVLIFAGLAPSLAAQPDTLDYDGPYYREKRDLQEGTAVGRKNTVMLGNSLTERGLWAEYFPGRSVVNRGIGGDCISGMTARIESITEGQPRAIFIMAGVNDLIFSKITPEHLLRQYERLLDVIKKDSPRTRVYIQSLLPLDEARNTQYFTGKNARIAAFDILLREMAERRGLVYIDIRSGMERDGKLPAEYTIDGIHLNAAGYAVWSETLKPYMK